MCLALTVTKHKYYGVKIARTCAYLRVEDKVFWSARISTVVSDVSVSINLGHGSIYGCVEDVVGEGAGDLELLVDHLNRQPHQTSQDNCALTSKHRQHPATIFITTQTVA